MRVDMLLGSPPSIKHLIPHEYNSLLLEGVKKGGMSGCVRFVSKLYNVLLNTTHSVKIAASW